MASDGDPNPIRSLRQLAFLAAATSCARDGAGLLQAHPDHDVLAGGGAQSIDTASMIDLLRREAARFAPTIGSVGDQLQKSRASRFRDSAAYYLARRAEQDVAALSQASRGIPPFWRRILDCRPERIRALARSIGRFALSGALKAMTHEERASTLARVPADAAAEILRWDSESAPALVPPVRAMLTACSRFNAELTAEEIGLMVLSALRMSLDDSARRAFRVLSRTNIDDVLQAHAGPEVDAAGREALQSVASTCAAETDAADPRAPGVME